MDYIKQIGDSIGGFFSEYGWKILFSLACVIIAYFLIKGICWLVRYILYKTKLDHAVVTFICSILKILLWVVLVLILAGVLQLSLSSVLVAFSSIALAVGLALKDSLANLANGILIIINKPFRRGDHISVKGVQGKVQNIRLMTTELLTFDNEKVILPNNAVVANELINYTSCPTRRVDYEFGVAYGTDMDKVYKIVLDMVSKNELILTYPEPAVFISKHDSSSVNFALRLWVKTGDYWTVKNALGKQILDLFSSNNVEIPFSQIDIHIKDTPQISTDKEHKDENA